MGQPIYPALHLKGLVDERQNKALVFFDEHPDILQVCDTLYLIGSAMPQLEVTGHGESQSGVWCNLLWQQAAGYLNDSFFLITQGSLDSGLALIRMSVELARDIAVLREAPHKEKLWRQRESQREKYRKDFKFNNKQPLGSIAHSLYSFCSKTGIHGHTTNFSHLESKPYRKDGGAESFRVSKAGIIEVIGVWMRAFAPVHGLCAASNSGSGPAIYTSREIYQSFKEAIEALPPVLKSLEDWVASVKNEASG